MNVSAGKKPTSGLRRPAAALVQAACCRSPKEGISFALLRRGELADVVAQQVRAGEMSFAEEFFSLRRVIVSIRSS